VNINLHKGTKIIHKNRIKRAIIGPNRKIRKAKNHHIGPRHQNLNRPPKNWKPPLPKKNSCTVEAEKPEHRFVPPSIHTKTMVPFFISQKSTP
jgi:hypothetical protein